jgi:hypothetical protein
VTPPDLVRGLEPVLRALRELGVAHYVSGSLASSLHGVPRASIDADVVADLQELHAGPLCRALEGLYYVPEVRVGVAVRERSSFNLIHLETMIKVDVFVSKDRPADRRALYRARLATFDEGTRWQAPAASAEDVVLAKLEWYRKGGHVSERQWSDVAGVLRVSRERLDVAYLRAGAVELGVDDLLDRAIDEAKAGPR